MRILTVGTLYPPHDEGGGYEILWRSAVAHLRAAGHEVRVLATDHRVPGRADTEPDVHRELRWYWRDGGFPRHSPPAVLAIERHNRRTLRRHLRDFRPDRIGFWSLGGLSLSLLEVARRSAVPATAFVIDDWLDYGRRADAFHRWFPRSVDFAEAAHYAFVSRTTRDHAFFSGVPTPDRSVVTAGIDPAFVDPAPLREWSGSLLYVGRLDARKGVATAIDALAHLPGHTLTIAGSGPEEAALRARAGDRVRFLGFVDHARLPELYAAADAVVFPVVWPEPWGLVPLEAMARGRPVVATGRGGSAEYLSDGVNALLFPAGDPEALAARVRELPAAREALVAAGIATARRHTEPLSNARIEATLVDREPPPVVASDDLVFFGDADEAAHRAVHRRLPDERWAVQGPVMPPRTALGRWLAGPPHPRGEIGPVHLDLRNASVKRSLLERAAGASAYELADAGLRLHHEPSLRVAVPAPALEDAAADLRRRLAEERELVAKHPHLVPRLAERVAQARAAGPARGRLGRALVAWVPPRVPLLGPAVWRNATDHYERVLARMAD